MDVTSLNGAADNEIGNDLIKHLHCGQSSHVNDTLHQETFNPISQRAPFVKKQEPVKSFSHFGFPVVTEVSFSLEIGTCVNPGYVANTAIFLFVVLCYQYDSSKIVIKTDTMHRNYVFPWTSIFNLTFKLSSSFHPFDSPSWNNS